MQFSSLRAGSLYRPSRPTYMGRGTGGAVVRCDGTASRSADADVVTGRRQAMSGLLIGATILGMSAAAPEMALAALLDLPSCGKYKVSSSGIEWCDVKEGKGDFVPYPGDVIVVKFTARASENGLIYDGSGNYTLTVGNQEIIPGWEMGILGDGDLPAIKQGGIRTLKIPAKLAYGERGSNCIFGRTENCRVPPNSSVEITFSLLGPFPI